MLWRVINRISVRDRRVVDCRLDKDPVNGFVGQCGRLTVKVTGRDSMVISSKERGMRFQAHFHSEWAADGELAANGWISLAPDLGCFLLGLPTTIGIGLWDRADQQASVRMLGLLHDRFGFAGFGHRPA